MSATLPTLTLPVPDGLLDVPFAQDRCRILRHESALALDPPLRRLSRASGAVDRALALRLARLQAGRGFVRLGYSRLADYARERLSLGARNSQDLAALGRGLGRFPLLDRALAAGRLGWTAACQVARVAGVEDEAKWVALAESVSVRVLKERVRAHLDGRIDDGGESCVKQTGCGGHGSGGGGQPCVTATTRAHDRALEIARDVEERGFDGDGRHRADDEKEEDPIGRMRVVVGSRTAFLWYAALDLCRRVAGANLSEAEAAEYVLAGFLSGAEPTQNDVPECYPLRPPFVVPSRIDASATSAWSSRLLPRRAFRALTDEIPQGGGFSTNAAEVRADVLQVVDSPVEDDVFGIDDACRRLAAMRVGLDLDLARLLRNFCSFSLHRDLGFERFEDYVEQRCGISVRRARFLVQLDRRLYHLAAIREAVAAGRVGVVAALLLARVAVPDVTEVIWARRAEAITVARLRAEVEWAERRARLSGRREHALPPESGQLPTALDELTQDLLEGRQTFAVAEALGCWNDMHATGAAAAVARQGDTTPSDDGPCISDTAPHSNTEHGDSARDDDGAARRGRPDSGEGAECTSNDAAPHRNTEHRGDVACEDDDTARRGRPDSGEGTECASNDASAADDTERGKDAMRENDDTTWHGCTDQDEGTVRVNDDGARSDTRSGRGSLGETDRAGSEGWRQTFARREVDIVVDFLLCASVAPLWTECRRRIARATGERFVPDRVVLHWITLDFLSTHLPAWLEASKTEDPIAVRERFCCAIPGCTSRGGSAHHIVFRSRGGSNEAENLTFLCFTHHIEALHRGHIRVRGTAPDALTIELGIKPDGTALERFVRGERSAPLANRCWAVPGSPTPEVAQ